MKGLDGFAALCGILQLVCASEEKDVCMVVQVQLKEGNKKDMRSQATIDYIFCFEDRPTTSTVLSVNIK